MQDVKISKELHRRVFELTLALYRVTDFFPQGEVLRRQLREKANEVFGRVSEYDFSERAEHVTMEILGRIQSVRGYLGVARSMRFVKPINLTVLEREYDFLADFFTRELERFRGHYKEESVRAPVARAPSDTKSDPIIKEEKGNTVSEKLPTWNEFSSHDAKQDMHHISETLNMRQEKILEHLKQSDKAKISDFYSIFNEISSKTIQRDLQDLVSKNFLKKDGEKRWTTYFLKGPSVQ